MQKKILIIEDEYDIASTMELALDMENYEVRLCSNGKEALTLLSMESLPNLVISDVMMPVMDGYNFTQEFRENPRYDKIPLVLTSAAPLDPEKLKKGDYQGFIRKPFDLDRFLELVEDILA